MPPLFAPTIKIFYRRLCIKRCIFAISQQELQNSTMLDGLLLYLYSIRLKSPCEIAAVTLFQRYNLQEKKLNHKSLRVCRPSQPSPLNDAPESNNSTFCRITLVLVCWCSG